MYHLPHPQNHHKLVFSRQYPYYYRYHGGLNLKYMIILLLDSLLLLSLNFFIEFCSGVAVVQAIPSSPIPNNTIPTTTFDTKSSARLFSIPLIGFKLENNFQALLSNQQNSFTHHHQSRSDTINTKLTDLNGKNRSKVLSNSATEQQINGIQHHHYIPGNREALLNNNNFSAQAAAQPSSSISTKVDIPMLKEGDTITTLKLGSGHDHNNNQTSHKKYLFYNPTFPGSLRQYRLHMVKACFLVLVMIVISMSACRLIIRVFSRYVYEDKEG